MMTKVLALGFFGLIYASSGISTKNVQPVNSTMKELENAAKKKLETDKAAASEVVAIDEAATPEVVAIDQAAAPPTNTMISKPKKLAATDKAAFPTNKMILKAQEKVVTDEAIKETRAIARAQERSREETKYAVIAAAQAVAENARTSMAGQLQQMHAHEVSEREKRETILKQTIDAAFARMPNFNLLKRKPAEKVTSNEAQAIQRVQERTREELEYKTIAAGLAIAEKARISAVAELENMREHEKETRKKTEATLKDALDSALANQG